MTDANGITEDRLREIQIQAEKSVLSAALWTVLAAFSFLVGLQQSTCHRKRHVRSNRVRKVCPTQPQPCKASLRSTTS